MYWCIGLVRAVLKVLSCLRTGAARWRVGGRVVGMIGSMERTLLICECVNDGYIVAAWLR